MRDTELLDWHDGLLVGHTAIDQEHREFSALIRRLGEAPDSGLEVALDAVLVAARAHFSHEDSVMEDSQFPPRGCHIREHAAVIASMTGVKTRLAHGEVQPVRQLANELTRWFPAHVQHLDSALAHWICKQSAGAKPLVFRRSTGPSPEREAA